MAQDVEIIPPEKAARHPVPHVLEAVATVPWAITDEALATIVAIAQRENDVSSEALEKMRGRRVANSEALETRNGVGIIKVQGPMFRYANLFTAFSGGATYDGIAADLERARADASISAIIFDWDSPGGEVSGCSELAGMIRAAAQEKPVESYVGGQCCSAAYWLASATSRITADRTAMLGSIGVKLAIRDSRERDAKSGVKTVEFISSRAPHKRMEWDSDEGRARIQRTADQLEAVFIADVAANRGVSEDEVIAKYGKGGVEVGSDAVAAGLADTLGSFEGVISRLARGEGRRLIQGRTLAVAENTTTPKTYTQAEVDAMIANAKTEGQTAGATAAQTRIAAIMGSEPAKTRPALASHFAHKTDMTAEAAIAALSASAEEKPAAAPQTQTQTAPAGRAQDAAGGLALATVTEGKDGKTGADATAEQPKPAKIDRGSIYGARAKAMGQRA